ncbi:MAG: hypothetical protein IH845_01225, partial [Nanoarchaeota archaeon]|nr:hypothetical protein [Nanoarchaeota archaeon]
MNKRGISAVVATVLIILITISSISIVWLMIMPLIRENLEFNSIERGVVIVTSGGYTVYDPERKIAAVKVKMEEDTVEIPFVEVIFMVDGNSIKFVRDFNLEINEDILFYFILNKKPESVSVAPIFRIGNKEKVGSIYNSVQLKSGDLT